MEMYWDSIPIGRENAISYENLCQLWGCSERRVRYILHELSYCDNGDPYILIRSSRVKGFYRTDNPEEIERYRKECTNKAKNSFAPLRKIRRVLRGD